MTNTYYDQHKETLKAAINACETRQFWSPFVESPSGKLHPEGAAEKGLSEFNELLGKPFELDQAGEIGRIGIEISPYTQEPLGIDYPKIDPDVAFDSAKKAKTSWQKVPFTERAAICLEMAFALEKNCFTNAHATMHTAGQSYLMAFSGSGANALDRGIEAIAYSYKALNDVAPNAQWTKNFGRAGDVTLDKTYRIVPRGTAVVVCCATFPLWNAYPALFANLVTGNPVIMKPHPNGILPVAMAVKICRKLLSDTGHDHNLVQLAADTREEPVTKLLLDHDECAIIDYTGSQQFGTWIVQNYPQKLVYSETAGCNGVVIESTDNLDGLVNGLANALCGFSAQMCTSPQNIHLSKNGFDSDQGHVTFDEFCQHLVSAINKRTADPLTASRLCATIQADQSLDILNHLREEIPIHGELLLDSKPYLHPEYQNARTATPMIGMQDHDAEGLYLNEHFAPVSFIVRENNAENALEHAASIAKKYGAISSYLYSVDRDFLEQAKDRFTDAGASLWCNMTVPMPINFAAAYSDYHVTGLNPAGNACLTDLAFVANRFRIVQFREPTNL